MTLTGTIFLGCIKKSSEIDLNTGEAKSSSADHENDVGPYVNEPVADEDWLAS